MATLALPSAICICAGRPLAPIRRSTCCRRCLHRGGRDHAWPGGTGRRVPLARRCLSGHPHAHVQSGQGMACHCFLPHGSAGRACRPLRSLLRGDPACVPLVPQPTLFEAPDACQGTMERTAPARVAAGPVLPPGIYVTARAQRTGGSAAWPTMRRGGNCCAYCAGTTG